MHDFPTKEEIIETRGKILTDEQRQQMEVRNRKIARKKEAGATFGELAKEFDLSRGYVKGICHRFGVFGKKKPSKFAAEKL